MEFQSQYVAHIPNAQGWIDYTDEDYRVWAALFEQQSNIILNRASNDFIEGLELLQFKKTDIPQLPDVNQRLHGLTGWSVYPVPALISARHFFELLAQKQFPAATFLRSYASLHYVKEPDLFHELFGHCPMLTHPVFSEFLCIYAKMVLSHEEVDWPLLQRLFWFTVEVGLIQTSTGLRIYGGGILSSIEETPYSLESDVPLRAYFDPVSALRTPYRIDQLQSIYFIISNYQSLYDLVSQVDHYLLRSRALGEYPPFFKTVSNVNDPNIHIHAC